MYYTHSKVCSPAGHHRWSNMLTDVNVSTCVILDLKELFLAWIKLLFLKLLLLELAHWSGKADLTDVIPSFLMCALSGMINSISTNNNTISFSEHIRVWLMGLFI
jgi:hypothetical protein